MDTTTPNSQLFGFLPIQHTQPHLNYLAPRPPTVRQFSRANRRATKTFDVSRKTRTLNCWMAFRTYYQPLLAGMEQKTISTYMTLLWSQDPSKHKWSILANAYTTIKNIVGKPKPPLNTFLELCAGEIGVLSREEYIKGIGCYFEVDERGMLRLVKTTSPPLPDHVLSNEKSSGDIVAYCLKNGYCNGIDGSNHDLLAHKPHYTDVFKSDARATAAQLLGFDFMDNFFQVSESPAIDIPGTDVSPGALVGPVYASDSSQLFNSKDTSMIMDHAADEEKWHNTDMGTTHSFTKFLGENIMDFNAPLFPAAPEPYSFHFTM